MVIRADTQVYKGQVFYRIGNLPYINRKGREVVIEHWRSSCLKCDELFTFTLPQRGEFSPKRHCDIHKKKSRLKVLRTHEVA